MTAPLSDDEVRAGYVKAMGSDLGDLYHELQNDVLRLQDKWSEFRELFASGDDRTDLLNSAAFNFFSFLHGLMYEDAMLHIARLTDPAESYGRRNLTVRRLSEVISRAGLKERVLSETPLVTEKCAFARRWRNKRLVHNDLDTLRRGSASGLPAVTCGDIEGALESLRGLLGIVRESYGMLPVSSMRDPWGAKSLVSYLERARRAMSDHHDGT